MSFSWKDDHLQLSTYCCAYVCTHGIFPPRMKSPPVPLERQMEAVGILTSQCEWVNRKRKPLYWQESLMPCVWEVSTCLMIITWPLTRAGCGINRADTWLPPGLIIILHVSLTSSYLGVEAVQRERPESSCSILLPWRTFSLWIHRCYIGILRRRMRD